ncbi:OmpA family protein [Vibrio sp. D431a]|uniref:OmpA/MotB family protein n=1 Tax=Vibrio sp. D431a TaxID=2837388 RepID=UPI0025562C28|nr:OmpA family protein [Vibrio sp. D431a]MDK9793924.1 OmpA family protein [Vibrio sp. D431a]
MSSNELIVKKVKKYADDGDAGAASAWKIALADFMCALMIVFFALWAVGNQPEENRQVIADYFRGNEISPDSSLLLLEATYEEVKEILEEQGVVVSFDKNNRSITLKFDSEMLFQSGSADLKPEAEETIERFMGVVQGTRFYWHVYGYTDDIPVRSSSKKFKNNLDLSLKRAASAAYVIMDNGVKSSHITIHGEGILNPLNDNSSAENRQNNRRVEIYMTETSIPSKVYNSHATYTKYEEGEAEKLVDEIKSNSEANSMS